MIKLIKLGGSLLKEKNSFELLKNILNKEINIRKNKIIMIVSAIGRKNDPYSTDTLKSLGNNLNKTDLDYLMGLGEIISSLVTSNNLSEFNPHILRYNKLGIVKDEKFKLNNENIIDALETTNLLIVPGFIALNSKGELITLNRGGSDLSAVLIAQMLGLKEITLYKETGGIMSGDPSLVASPSLIKNLSYDEAYKLSKMGAKVIQKDAVNYAKEKDIKIKVKSLYLDEVGTIISKVSEKHKYLGLSSENNIIYLIGNVSENDVEVIKSLMKEYNITINKIRLKDYYILIEVINGKRNFALNLIHHKFINKR